LGGGGGGGVLLLSLWGTKKKLSTRAAIGIPIGNRYYNSRGGVSREGGERPRGCIRWILVPLNRKKENIATEGERSVN